MKLNQDNKTIKWILMFGLDVLVAVCAVILICALTPIATSGGTSLSGFVRNSAGVVREHVQRSMFLQATGTDAGEIAVLDGYQGDPSKDGVLTASIFTGAEGELPAQTLTIASGKSLRMTVKDEKDDISAISLKVLTNARDSGIEYSVYKRKNGWINTEGNGEAAGEEYAYDTTEAVMFWLTGEISETYDIWYRAYVQDFGWLDWTYNGQPAGSKDLSLRLEGIEIRFAAKNAVAPGSMERPYMDKKAMQKIFDDLKAEYPEGAYWNHMGGAKNGSITKIPCDHTKNEINCNTYEGKSTIVNNFGIGRQCAGFASMLSDRIFGKDAEATMFYDYDEVCIGDQVRMYDDSHTALIIDKTDEYIVVAECNADYLTCRINWGRKVPRSELDGYFIKRR